MQQSKPSAKLQKHNNAGVDPKRFSLRGSAPVPKEFYSRAPQVVAPELLGKILVRKDPDGVRAGRIVELEAYLGLEDAAAHAAAGKTPRNAVLFGPPGHAYIYFIYGNHYCLNVSCEREGHAGSVLIRALEPVAGLERMAAARDLDPDDRKTARLLASGPGRLAEALDITRERDNGKDVTSRRSDLQIVDDGWRPEKVIATPRIGITKAAEALLRFVVAGSPWASGKKTLLPE